MIYSFRPSADDVKRELRKVRDRHPRGRDQVKDILARFPTDVGGGATSFDDIPRSDFCSVYGAARECHCGSPKVATQTAEHVRKSLGIFRIDRLALIETHARRSHWGHMLVGDVIDRFSKLSDIETRYTRAKELGAEHAYPLVDEINRAESGYESCVSTLAGMISRGTLPNFPAPDSGIGSAAQLETALTQLDYAQGIADFVAERPNQFDIAEKIEARYIEDVYFGRYDVLKDRWAELAKGFERREQKHAVV